jgi:mannose-6-phosphate isomerase-like protein (cupin superfamily)
MTESGRPVQRFTFHEATFSEVAAHGAETKIRAARVLDRTGGGTGSNLRFIDLVEVPTDAEIGFHRHSLRDEEAYIVIAGRAQMFIDGLEVTVGPGDVVLNPPGGCHGLRNVGSETVRLVVLEANFEG